MGRTLDRHRVTVLDVPTKRAKRPNGYWDDVILPEAVRIVESYETDVILRQLHYRLVSKQITLNTVAEYGQLSSRTATARRLGQFPELKDRTREIVQAQHWDDAASALRDIRDWFRVDRTEGQAWTVFLGVEKSGLVEQLRSWFGDRLGVPILSLRGYHSESYERQIAEHIARYDRPSVLLYAGDLDPSGEDIFRNLLRHTDFTEAHRITLTVDQAVEYDLPPMMGKKEDTRSGAFIAKHGDLFQIEVDALPPDVLRGIFADALADYWDDDAYDRALGREAFERGELAA